MPSAVSDPVTIRSAYADDAASLARLAALDSAEVPAGPMLIAEVEGELRAALSLRDGAALADPFVPTVALVRLLRLRAELMGGRPDQRHALRRAIRRAGRLRRHGFWQISRV